MNRQILRFYVFVLTLLEISLNSKLTAQGKSHGVLHDPLISDGITFQEWGTETVPVDTGGDPGAEAALTVSPAELHFGPSELGVAHARTVTLTNRSNSTLHLASVAGSTPHFHASFFDSKTLAPHANTSFSVVFVGRREGLASARLHLHSSAAPLAYSVSAVGVASRWGLWPWLHAAVPAGARLAPTLSLTNPTDKPVQVLSVYSSAPWLGLELAGGGGWAPRSAWTLPPRAARPLVAVRLQPPPNSAENHTRTKAAYIRIKTEIGSLVVGVEARAAPRGLFLAPLGLRAGARGSRDPPLQMEVSFGNSAGTALPLDAWLSPPHCAPLETAPAPPDPPEPRGANGGARPAGVSLTLLMNTVEANSPLKKGAIVTFDFEKLWSSYTGPAPTGALLCAGWLTAGGAAAPYSVALQRGTLAAPPPVFVTSSTAAPPAQPLVVHNEFRFPVLVTRLQPPPALLAHVQMSKFSQVTIGPGARAELVTLRPRPAAPPGAACAPPFQHPLTIHTNFTDYVVMVSCYSGLLELQFQWPDSAWSDLRHLRLGGVPAGAAVAVPLRVRNPAPAPLCLSRLHAAVGAVTPATARTGCIPPGGSLLGTYVVRAPAAGALTDAVGARSEGAEGRGGGLLLTRVSLHAMDGKVTVDDVELKGCAPWVPCSGPLVVRSTARTQAGVGVRTGRPAIVHEYSGPRSLPPGVTSLGTVTLHAELLPGHRNVNTSESSSWRRLAAARGALRADAALLAAPPQPANLTLSLYTAEIVKVPILVRAQLIWPRLSPARALSPPPAAPRAPARAPLLLRNPSARPLWLRAFVAEHYPMPDVVLEPGPSCLLPDCSPDASVFNVSRAGAEAGGAGGVEGGAGGGVEALLAPGEELPLTVTFTPQEAMRYQAFLYIRNNLTVMEAVRLRAAGARPAIDLPVAARDLLFQVTSCETAGLPRGAAPPLTLTVRNPAAVPLLLGAPALAAPALRAPPAPRACAAHGFRVTPCEPRELKENESVVFTVEFTTDWTLSRVSRALWLATSAGAVEVSLRGEVAPRLLAGCGGAGAGGGGGGARALLAGGAAALGALVLGAALLDAEAVLRRARAAPRPAPPARRAPLDLRRLNHHPTPPAPAPAPAPPPPAKRKRVKKEKKESFWKLDEAQAALLRELEAEAEAEERAGAGRGERGGRDPSRSSTEEQEASPAATRDQSEAEEEPPAPAPPAPEPDDDAASATDSSHSDEPPAPPAPCTHEPRPRAPRPAPPRPSDQPRLRPNKFHVKKEKSVKRRVAAAAPRASPPAPAAPAPPAPPPALRRTATFSEVVARSEAAAAPAPAPPAPPRPLAPIGSARPRGDAPSSAHSLFYFNGDVSEREAWEPPAFPRAPAAPSRGHNYTEDQPAEYTSPALGSSLWSTDSWSWSYAEVRPPPGFAPPAPPAAPPARAYDPFHALAAIWASDRPAWADPADEPRNNQQQQQ